MHACADTAPSTPNERLHEVASILAVAILRLRERAALPTGGTDEAPEIPATGLEVPGETVLSVHTG